MVRVLVSAALVAVVVYFAAQNRGPQSRKPTVGVTAPLPVESASAERQTRFNWVPVFESADVDDIRTQQSHEKISYGFHFVTAKRAAEILNFYETHLRAAGFMVVRQQHQDGGDLHAENPDRKRLLDVVVAQLKENSQVGVTATERY